MDNRISAKLRTVSYSNLINFCLSRCSALPSYAIACTLRFIAFLR